MYSFHGVLIYFRPYLCILLGLKRLSIRNYMKRKFDNLINILNLLVETCLRKFWTGPCLPLCNISSSFTSCQTSGTEETSCWTFGRGTVSHSSLIQVSSCPTAPGLLCWILNVFSWWKLWTAGRSVQHPDYITMKRWGLWFNVSCWNMQAFPWKRRSLH